MPIEVEKKKRDEVFFKFSLLQVELMTGGNMKEIYRKIIFMRYEAGVGGKNSKISNCTHVPMCPVNVALRCPLNKVDEINHS